MLPIQLRLILRTPMKRLINLVVMFISMSTISMTLLTVLRETATLDMNRRSLADRSMMPIWATQ